ncbi:hypothetical protein WQ57_11360 [Mesobacillus campisalis]|uniref:Uncharacterized protein n=1 Tax=Mesobacillus campisalis TaxID=1408103 RepID=A0A0M2SZP8_9BACI|nr:hypothetical protein [Mesobacillus campisalis]KKK38075.1 hypothetical protein WQ57_11360 [Mesobacillus campisalis]
MQHSTMQSPIWAWLVLIGGGLFLISALPGIIFTVLMTFFKPNELSFVSFIMAAISVSILFVTGWAMKRAYRAIKAFNEAKQGAMPAAAPAGSLSYSPLKTKKPIWPWVVIVPGILLMIKAGAGVMMLPIMPIFLAGMSTDSGTAPDYLPFLIIVGGYGLMIVYIILVVRAIKALRGK